MRDLMHLNTFEKLLQEANNALIAQAALGLANAHAPLAAAPYIEVLRAGFPGNRAILSACDSIINGL